MSMKNAGITNTAEIFHANNKSGKKMRNGYATYIRCESPAYICPNFLKLPAFGR